MFINLINDMMDLAYSEKQKLDFNNSLFDLEKLVHKCFETLGFLIIEK